MKAEYYVKFDDGEQKVVTINERPLANMPLSMKNKMIREVVSIQYGKECVYTRRYSDAHKRGMI